jgi:hypothetical protein
MVAVFAAPPGSVEESEEDSLSVPAVGAGISAQTIPTNRSENGPSGPNHDTFAVSAEQRVRARYLTPCPQRARAPPPTDGTTAPSPDRPTRPSRP